MTDDAPPPSRRTGAAKFLSAAALRLRPPAGAPGAMPVSSRLSTWVGILSAVTGGFLGLTTYREDVAKKVDQRVEKTFDLVERFQGGDLEGPRTRVLSYVQARRLCDARVFSRDLTDDDFVRVIDFFDLVEACVKADLCDRATALRFFGPYADHQQPILEKVIADLRAAPQSMRADAGFGDGLKALAAKPAPAPPCDGNF
jgi:hypothetical protein